jgi:hypothetical protein
MIKTRFLVPAAALGLGMMLAGGLRPADAAQAGATDPSLFNTEGPGAANTSRPTLVLPEREPANAAAHPADSAPNSGWSPVGGPYSTKNGGSERSGLAPMPNQG